MQKGLQPHEIPVPCTAYTPAILAPCTRPRRVVHITLLQFRQKEILPSAVMEENRVKLLLNLTIIRRHCNKDTSQQLTDSVTYVGLYMISVCVELHFSVQFDNNAYNKCYTAKAFSQQK
jgi:hypothetical protein